MDRNQKGNDLDLTDRDISILLYPVESFDHKVRVVKLGINSGKDVMEMGHVLSERDLRATIDTVRVWNADDKLHYAKLQSPAFVTFADAAWANRRET